MDLWATGDASFGSERRGRSRGGLTIHLGFGPIYWRSYKQPIVTLSSGESETVTLTDAVREATTLRIFGMKLLLCSTILIIFPINLLLSIKIIRALSKVHIAVAFISNQTSSYPISLCSRSSRRRQSRGSILSR